MSWKRIAEVAAIVGKYQKDGQEKNKYLNCGVILENENGNKCIKLTSLPFKDDGMLANFFGIYPLKDDAGRQQQKPQTPSPGKRDEFDDDIPWK